MRLPGDPATSSRSSTSAEVERHASARPTRPPSTRCGPAPRCSSSCAAPTPAPGSCSTTTRSTPGATPTATSSSTTSPSRASTRSFRRTATPSSCATSGSLNGTYVNRERDRRGRAAHRRRGPDRQVPPRVLRGQGLTPDALVPHRVAARAPRRTMTIGAVLAALQPDFPDVTISKIRFLEAEGLVTPARTGSGYRTYSDGRRRPAALRPHRPARPVLAAEGHPRRPRRHGPRPDARPSPRAVTAAAPRARARRRPRRAHGAAELAAPQHAAADPRRAGRRGRARRRRPSTPWRPSACCAPTPTGHFGEGRSRSRAPPPRSRHTASSPGTCGRSAPPPTARSGWSSRSSRRTVGAGRARSGRAKDPTAEVLRLCIALHTALVKDGLPTRLTPTTARLTDVGPARPGGVRWRSEGPRRPRGPGRDADQPADRAAARARRRPLPADLDRRGGGHRHRLRPAGHRAAAAADPRPHEERHRGAGPPAHRGADRRAARRGLPRGARSSTARPRSRRAPPTPSPSPCAPARRSSRASRSSRRPASRCRPRRTRTTRWRSSASSSTTSRPRTSRPARARPGPTRHEAVRAQEPDPRLNVEGCAVVARHAEALSVDRWLTPACRAAVPSAQTR